MRLGWPNTSHRLLKKSNQRLRPGHTVSLLLNASMMGDATLQPKKVYTGDKILGIGTLHKSNAVPVFSVEEAQDMAKMRR